MNDRPITQSKRIALKTSLAALRRAAQCARERAQQTGTPLVVSQAGVVYYIDVGSVRVAETHPDYGDHQSEQA